MTREEEIKNEAELKRYDIASEVDYMPSAAYDGFVMGAEWADKTMIEKVCKWVNDIDFDMEYWNCENGFCKEMFIDAFKKAMRE